MTRAFALIPLVVAVVFGGFFLWGLDPDRDPNDIPSVLISQPAPEFVLSEVEGLDTPSFSREDLSGNSGPVIVNVFASWCVPCRAEHPFLMELAKRPDIQVVGLNYKDKPANARRFLGTHGNPYERVGVDPNGRVSVDWGVYGVPETFVVDKKGVIRFKQIGPLTQDSLKRFLPQIEAAKVELVR